MKNKVKKKEGETDRVYGLAIPAFLLIGIGVGLLTGQVAAFTMIGLGVGFVVAFFFSGKKK